MAFDSHNSNTSDGRVVVDLCGDEANLYIDHIDVEIDEDIGFEVRGHIKNVDEDVLDALSDHSITPAEVHFCTH